MGGRRNGHRLGERRWPFRWGRGQTAVRTAAELKPPEPLATTSAADRPLLRELLALPEFAKATHTTRFVEEYLSR